MHQIYQGTNVDRLIGPQANDNFDCIYVNQDSDLSFIISRKIYQSSYGEESQDSIDIPEDLLNKALTIKELTGDIKLTLQSLLKD